MQSRWAQYKEEALSLRRKGKSIREIELTLGISRSTLSGWFKNVSLTNEQKNILAEKHKAGLAHARTFAANKHREMKRERIDTIRNAIKSEFTRVASDTTALEVGLAMLYLGEGRKAEVGLGLGNSNPMVMRFYVRALRKLYDIKADSFRVELHLRADQDADELVTYWSRAIDVPKNRFKYVLKDKRTVGKPTYPHYRGVCFISGGGVEIQRRLLYLAEMLCGFHQ